MNALIYELTFRTGVHFGDRLLTESLCSFSADVLFSAMYQEALKISRDKAEAFLKAADSGALCWSDAMPRMDGKMYLPKPYVPIEKKNNEGNSSVKKAYKRMQYVAADVLTEYLNGDMPIERTNDLADLGKKDIRTNAAVRGKTETEPYRVGIYRFNEDCGLNIILKYNKPADKELFAELLYAVSVSGLGGKRSSGLGRFDYKEANLPSGLNKRMDKEYKTNMTLSVALPKDEEMDAALKDSHYKVIKRAGFVASAEYADEQRRKKDLYLFAAGSCFDHPFTGVIADVSNGGRHAVYRYAKPLWMGVK